MSSLSHRALFKGPGPVCGRSASALMCAGPKFWRRARRSYCRRPREREHILGFKLGGGKSGHIENCVTRWHIISSILIQLHRPMKSFVKKKKKGVIVNNCLWCQSLIQVREFNSAPVGPIQWPIYYEVKWQTIGGVGWGGNKQQQLMCTEHNACARTSSGL